MLYKGGCHCGRIAFEIEGEIQNVMECNCSICTKRGYLLWFIPREKMKLKTPEKDLSTYLFNKRHIKHRFCASCGCGPFGEATDPKSGTAMAAINVRCLEDIDLASIKKAPFDGRSK